MAGKNAAPVEHVGGETGPWPDEVDEIATGEVHQRPVVVDNGILETVPVTVTDVQQIEKDGEPTDGYSIAYQHDVARQGQGGGQ